MAQKVKLSIGEWLCMFRIIKRGRFQHYETEYVLNTKDEVEVFNAIDKMRLKGPKLRVDADYVNHTYFHNYVDAGIDMNGKQRVELETIFQLSKTDDGNIKIRHICNDYAECNARIAVELGLKRELGKKFGFIE